MRQPLVDYAKTHPDVRVMDGRFMEIQQAMGTPKGRAPRRAYLRGFVEEMKASGFVADALKRSNHRTRGRAARHQLTATAVISPFVMAGLVPAIHVLVVARKTWMRGSSPRMTNERVVQAKRKPGYRVPPASCSAKNCWAAAVASRFALALASTLWRLRPGSSKPWVAPG